VEQVEAEGFCPVCSEPIYPGQRQCHACARKVVEHIREAARRHRQALRPLRSRRQQTLSADDLAQREAAFTSVKATWEEAAALWRRTTGEGLARDLVPPPTPEPPPVTGRGHAELMALLEFYEQQAARGKKRNA
jgi:predicted nucleic acid-binding Zn ribbon protein